MGWMNSWIGFKDIARDDLLNAIGMELTDTQVLPYSGEARLCLRDLPNGWSIVFSADFDWASRERVRELSRLGLVLGCQFEDKIEMTSTACAALEGAELWRVHHDNIKSHFFLDISGEPPAAFEAIRSEHVRLQEEDGGEDSSTDFFHDVPLEVAKSVCGYRHDDGDPATLFIALKRIGAEEPEQKSRPGFLGLLKSLLKRQ